MKKIFLSFILITLTVFNSFAEEVKSVEGELIIQIKRDVATFRTASTKTSSFEESAVSDIANKYGGKSIVSSKREIEEKPSSTTFSLKSTQSTIKEKIVMKITNIDESQKEDVINELKALPNVEKVEPNYIFNMNDFNSPTNNTNYSDQWYLQKNNTPQAWNLFDETSLANLSDVVVAVLDSGVDYTHEDLVDAMWHNPGEIPNNNIDDDNNGYIDDYYGANVLYKSEYGTASADYTDPMDNHGHGTHVAGIIAATNNDKGIIGIASGVKIMAIKCARADGSLTTEDIVKAVDYARTKNAHVANMSFGGGADSSILKDALADLSATTALVASAGNSAKPVEWDLLDTCGMKGVPPAPNYPAAYPFVLGVEASDQNGAKAGFSNCDPVPYSSLEYEVRLPGVSITSTLPGNAYAAWNGTSMAAPIASALAALIKAKHFDKQDIFTNRMVQGQVAKFATNFTDALTQLPKPDLKFFAYEIFDPNGDSDGIADAGETVTLALKVKNYWGAAKNVKLTVYPGSTISGTSTFSADDFVTIDGATGANGSKTIDIPAVGSYTIGNNGIVTDEYGDITEITIPIDLVVDASAPNLHRSVFTVDFEYENAIDDTDTTVYTSGTSDFSFDLQNGIEVGGTINSDTTWVADSRIIVKEPLLISEGVRLTISEGVEVRFDPNTFIKVEGTVRANGTKENKILFTSNQSIDMESNTWIGLRFSSSVDFTENGLGSILDYVIVENMRFSQESNGEYMYALSGRAKFMNSIFRKIFSYYSASGFKFENCLIDYSENFWIGYMVDTPLYDLTNSLLYGFNHNTKGSGAFPAGLKLKMSQLVNSAYIIEQSNYDNTFRIEGNDNDPSSLDSLIANLYIAGDRSVFKKVLYDYNDNFKSDYIFLGNTNEEMLAQTMPTPPETTPAFLVSAEWLDDTDTAKTILEVGNTYKLRLTFNKEKMQTAVKPIVTFGSLYPYTDKSVEGDWLDTDANGLAKVWEGTYTVNYLSGTGANTIRVSGAFDDDMYYDAPISEIYQFSIIESGAQAMLLQANGGNGKVDLSWMQDDYELVGGYNLYRGEIDNDADNYEKINQTPILGVNYTDTAVDSGKTYYYIFKAILSDGSVAGGSNIASATVLDNTNPVISHTPVTKVAPGSSAWISATVTDNIEVSSVKIYYKVTGGGTYTTASMTQSGDDYTFTIPSSFFGVSGTTAEYYIEATDSTGNISTTDTITMYVSNEDIAPSINQVADITVAENSSSFNVPITVSDPDGDAVSVYVSSSNSSIVSVSNYTNNSITLVPQTNQYGTVTITVTASNNLSNSMSFDVTLTHADQIPVITKIDNITKVKDFADFDVIVNATDPDGDAISYSITNSNSNIIDATISGNTITISSIPYAVGQSTITVSATANGKTVSTSFLVEVLLSSDTATTTYNYQLNAGWNLVGFLPAITSISQLPSELQDSANVHIIWKYDNANSKWLGYSPDSTIATKLTNMQLTTIDQTDGVWIYCKKPVLVTLINPPEPTMGSYDIQINEGWNLISSPDGTQIDPSTFTDAYLVWAYRNGKWEVYSSNSAVINQANSKSVPIMNKIYGAEGFWVYKQP
jgi:subtilisin family serine protease